MAKLTQHACRVRVATVLRASFTKIKIQSNIVQHHATMLLPKCCRNEKDVNILYKLAHTIFLFAYYLIYTGVWTDPQIALVEAGQSLNRPSTALVI